MFDKCKKQEKKLAWLSSGVQVKANGAPTQLCRNAHLQEDKVEHSSRTRVWQPRSSNEGATKTAGDALEEE